MPTQETVGNLTAAAVKRALAAASDPTRATHSLGFFKTGPGEYGEGDTFIGVTVPSQRHVAKQYRDLSLAQVGRLLASPIHEHRLTGLLILVQQFDRETDPSGRRALVEFYLAHLAAANNWDLVDLSAPKILGQHLIGHKRERAMLTDMARSSDLWRRRVAVLATLPLIKRGETKEIMRLARMLLADQEDLMHKAVGWMLREVGKVEPQTLDAFLDRQATKMPRTMLRYAIERMPEAKRKGYLNRRSQ